MGQFRFTAVDAAGQTKRGTIESPSEAEAASKIAERGLRVTQITPVGTAPPLPAGDSPWHAGQDAPPHAPPQINIESDWRARLGAAGLLLQSRAPSAPLALSGLAVVLAFAALIVAFSRDPLGKGIKGYDFSTPEAAAKSMLLIDSNRDIRAHLDLEGLKEDGNPKDAARTLEINRVADFGDKKVVFASYLQKGRKRKRLFGFEKDLESKLWVPAYVGAFEVRKTNEQLAKEMEAWEAKEKD